MTSVIEQLNNKLSSQNKRALSNYEEKVVEKIVIAFELTDAGEKSFSEALDEVVKDVISEMRKSFANGLKANQAKAKKSRKEPQIVEVPIEE